MGEHLPLILMPGLGADRRLFGRQAAAFDNLVFPNWIEPQRGDTLASYAERVARQVDPKGPCLVGGCSLGGMVALEMSCHLDAKACLLISSIRSPDELPRRFRSLKPLASTVPAAFGRLLATVPVGIARAMLLVGRRRQNTAVTLLAEQCAGADRRFLWWAAKALLNWSPSCRPWRLPIAHIHGDRDHVLPHRCTQPDVVIPGAGHLAVITHADQVNAFLAAEMERYAIT